MAIPQDLIEQIRRGNVVLFLGAGISVSAGLPSGDKLMQEMAERAELGDIGRMSFPQVAQAYAVRRGHQSLVDFLSNRIDDPNIVPSHIHHLIAALPFDTIVTTNWDQLLEEALRAARRPFVKVVRDTDIPSADRSKVLLIKLHGSIEQKDSIVASQDAYFDIFSRLPEIARMVGTYFATKTLLFVGYNLADDDFRRLHQEAVRHLGHLKRRAYAVQRDPKALTVEWWWQKNVQVVAADAEQFLHELRMTISLPVREVASQPSTAVPATTPPITRPPLAVPLQPPPPPRPGRLSLFLRSRQGLLSLTIVTALLVLGVYRYLSDYYNIPLLVLAFFLVLVPLLVVLLHKFFCSSADR